MKKKSLIYSLLFLTILSFSCEQDQIEPTIEEEEEVIIEPVPVYQDLNSVFPIEEITNFELEISTAEWNRLLTNNDLNGSNKEYIAADLEITQNNNATKFEKIGLRIRGNTSRRRPESWMGEPHNPTNPDWNHASFSLNLKEFIKGQRFKGEKKINLKWFKDDANYIRELYCYDLFERFGVWTAPQSSYCTLSIKINEDNKAANFGVYEMVESIDENYLKSRKQLFGSSDGNLWKCSRGANLKNNNKSIMGVEEISLDGSIFKTYIYDLQTNEENLESAQTQLSDFINNLNSKTGESFKNWITSVMDVDLFLKTYAVNVMVGSWDDYWANESNYYIYLDKNNQFFFIPYDFDNTLGTSQLGDSGTQNMLKWGDNFNSPLVAKILTIPEFKTIYVNYLYDLVNPTNDFFYSEKSIARIENWQSMINPYVSNDTGEDMKIGDYPAWWGNQPQYRLNSLTNNFFVIKQSHLPAKP